MAPPTWTGCLCLVCPSPSLSLRQWVARRHLGAPALRRDGGGGRSGSVSPGGAAEVVEHGLPVRVE